MKTDRRKYSKLKGLHNDRNDRDIVAFVNYTNKRAYFFCHFYKCHAERVTTIITIIHKDLK